DTDDSNCWEHTSSATSTCGPVTVDNDETIGRIGSPGADNNLAVADIEVTVISSTPQPTSGTNMTYTVTVVNNSSSNTSTGIAVSDVLPADVLWVSDDGAGTYNNVTGVWNAGSVAAASSKALNITVTVTAAPTTSIDNTASITASATPDPDLSNNTDTVTVTVNQLPVANDDNLVAVTDTPTTILVLANDSDPDGDPLTISGFDALSALGGTVDCSSGTSCTYISPLGHVSPPTDSFNYTISDGFGGSSGATATITVNPAPTILVSEIAYNGAYADGDFVELYNPSGSAMPIGGLIVRFDDEAGPTGNDVTVPVGVILDPGEHYLIVEKDSALDAGAHLIFDPDNGNDSFGVALDWGGTILDAVGTGQRNNNPIVAPTAANREGAGVPPMFADASFPDQSYEREFGLADGNCVDTDDNAADFFRNYLGGSANPEGEGVIQSCGTPSPPPTSATGLVISEYRTDGPTGGSDEFTEIFNPTSSPILLVGTELYDVGGTSVEYQFLITDAGDGFLDPGEYMVVGGPGYTGATDATMTGGGIGNGGAHIQLRTIATGTVIDAVGPGLPTLDGRVDQTYERRGSGCVDTDSVTDWLHQLLPTPTLTVANGGSTFTCP
ncbi:MAG: cadherin-like domain-containing protein, partial [Acidimicrobiia bacterium]|nr:cadherin-like domain-containing protein [Acidimicrobiia bacterium]